MLCAILLLVSAGTAVADEQRAMLTLRVNMLAKQDVTVTLRDGDILVRRSDLQDAGLRGFAFDDTGKPSDLIPLSSLQPALKYHVDDRTLVLDITVTPEHLETTLVDYRSREDIALSKPVKSAFLNYSVSTSNQTGAAFSGEFGTHLGAGMFSSTVSVAANQQYRSNITRWILDSPQSDRRLTIGDVVTTTGDLGGTVAIAGFGLQRYFGLNPDTVRTVLPQITGSALTPSTADVYVNGILYRHETLPPGQFNFQNLPISEGPNTTTIVVTDAFGRRQTYSNTFYGADTLLAKGLSDFSYGVGVLHSQFGEQTGHGAAIAGRYAQGFTDDVTGGGRLEISGSIVSGGPAFTFRLPQGVFGVEAALSRAASGSGDAALVSYQHSGARMTGGLSLTIESAHYSSLALAAFQDRPVLNGTFTLAEQLDSRHAVSVSYLRQQDRDNGAQSGWQVSQTALLSDSTQLQVSENLTGGAAGRQFGIVTSLNFIPRRGYNASLTASQAGGHTQAQVQIGRALSSETPAFGYTVSATTSQASASGFASADYRGQYGDYITDIGVGAGQAAFDLTVAGGLVFIGGKLFPTQSINDSYALVDTGGLAHVRILANNVVVGRTDKHGYLLVPQLGSYYNNNITIASADTPLNYSIDSETQRLAPMYRSGDVVQFGVNRVHPVTGSVTVRMGRTLVVPAYGILEVEAGAGPVTSDIGENGEFYFDKLAGGIHHAHITFKGGECRFDLMVPGSKSMFIKLGALVCANGVRS